MSGICAAISFDGRSAVEEAARRMLVAAAHRGRDGRGSWNREGAALGHLALHITPEDQSESQPLESPDGRYVIVADARVDNRDELYSKLRGGGLLRSDVLGNAELLLAAYRKWGADCIRHLLGDYAFVIWDSVNRSCFAGRDPMSMRPLYYRRDGGRLLIASEIGQILAAGDVPRKLFKTMAGAWLMAEAGEPSWTFFEGIKQLPAAHVLHADALALDVARAWDLDPDHRIRYRSDEEYADHFREILLEAARCRMRSRHPAGIFQSGGLDSVSAGAASGWILKNDPPDPTWPSVTAYAYRYEHFPECDERHISGPLAALFDFRHEEVPSSVMLQNPALAGPWDDSGPVTGMYRALHEEVLARARAAGIRQMYTGARGDSMMGAFVWDHLGLLASGHPVEAIRELRRYRDTYGISTSQALRRTIVRSLVAELSMRSGAFRGLNDLRRRLKASARNEEPPVPWLDSTLVQSVRETEDEGENHEHHRWVGARGERYEAIHHGFTLMGNIAGEHSYARLGLQYEDLWSDRRIAEFVAAVPQYVLNRTNDTKRLSRMALKGILPDHVRSTSRKIIPAREGTFVLRKHRAILLDATNDMRLAEMGLVEQHRLHQHVQGFLDGGELESAAWCAMTLEAWLRSME